MTKGEKIKELRRGLGLSQVELARKIGVSKQTLYKYENDIITNIPSDKIMRLSEELGSTPAFLMGWYEDKYQLTDPTILTDKQIQYNAYSKEIMETDEKFMDVLIKYHDLSSKDKERFYDYWNLFIKSIKD